MKPGKVINTRQPEQGLGAFVRAAWRLASAGNGMHASHQASLIPAVPCAGLGGLDRAEDQGNPGEGRV